MNAFFPCTTYLLKHYAFGLCLVFIQLWVGFFWVWTKSLLCLNLRGWIGRIYYLKAHKAFFLMAKDLKSGTWLWYVILIRCCIFRLVNLSLFKQICSMISWELHFKDVWNQNISISISVHTRETHSPANGMHAFQSLEVSDICNA